MVGNDECGLRTTGPFLAALVAATAVVSILPCFFSSSTPIDRLLPLKCLSFGVMAIVPFAFAVSVPRAASFDNQWLPHARSEWAWFVLMVALGLPPRHSHWRSSEP